MVNQATFGILPNEDAMKTGRNVEIVDGTKVRVTYGAWLKKQSDGAEDRYGSVQIVVIARVRQPLEENKKEP